MRPAGDLADKLHILVSFPFYFANKILTILMIWTSQGCRDLRLKVVTLLVRSQLNEKQLLL